MRKNKKSSSMEKLLLIGIVLLISVNTYSQDFWAKNIGTSLNDVGQAFIQDTDSTLLIFGWHQENGGMLIKTNLDGDTIFSKFYPQLKFGKDIIKITDNEYLLLGKDGDIAKIGAKGEVIWQQKILNSNTYKLIKVDNNQFIVGGSIIVFDHIEEVPDLGLDSIFQVDILLKKYNLEGNCLKTDTIKISSDSDWASDLVFKDDTLYVLSTTYLNGLPNISLIKLNLDFQILNDTIYQNDGIYSGTSFVLNKNNDLIITGVKWKDFTEQRNLFITKFSANGDILWEKDINYDSTDEGIKIIQSKDDDFYVLGQTVNSQNGDKQVRDLILLKVDESGIIELNKLIDIPGRKMGYSILEITKNNLMILATTDNLTHGSADILLINSDSTGYFPTNVQQINIQEKSFSVFPNPTNGHFLIKSSTNQNFIKQLSLLNMMGLKINDYQLTNGQEFYINGVKGIYFLEIIDKNNQIQIFKIIKQ
jgi:hypothetical protein